MRNRVQKLDEHHLDVALVDRTIMHNCLLDELYLPWIWQVYCEAQEQCDAWIEFSI